MPHFYETSKGDEMRRYFTKYILTPILMHHKYVDFFYILFFIIIDPAIVRNICPVGNTAVLHARDRTWSWSLAKTLWFIYKLSPNPNFTQILRKY